MDSVGTHEAQTHLTQLLDRVEQGESLEITRNGKPVARIVPVDDSRKEAKEALARIRARRARIKGVPLAELMKTVHEGHRW